jgi:hypothetical protein
LAGRAAHAGNAPLLPRGKREEGRGKREEGRGKREEGRAKSLKAGAK